MRWRKANRNRKRRERRIAHENRVWKEWFADEERNQDRRREHYHESQSHMRSAISFFSGLF